MSAFTPYKKSRSDETPLDYRIKRNMVEFPVNLTSVLLNLDTLQRNLIRLNCGNAVSEQKQVENSEKFYIKNILRSEEVAENQRREKKRMELEETASRMETIVSNLGKSDIGHKCIYCGKVYSRKYGLKIHIRTHTGYKPLKCKFCLRPFGDPSNLNKHVRLHSRGHTPYNCRFCGKILVRRRDLERHLKSKHSEESS